MGIAHVLIIIGISAICAAPGAAAAWRSGNLMINFFLGLFATWLVLMDMHPLITVLGVALFSCLSATILGTLIEFGAQSRGWMWNVIGWLAGADLLAGALVLYTTPIPVHTIAVAILAVTVVSLIVTWLRLKQESRE